MRGRIALVVAAFALAGCGGDDPPDAERERDASPTAAAEQEPSADEAARACTPSPREGLTTRARFKPGDTRAIRIEKQRTENGREQSASATARLEVLASRRLRWTSEDVVLAEPLPPEEFVMEYSVDRDGVYERLENLEEVRAIARRMFDELRGREKATAEQREAVRRIRKLMLADAFLQNSLTMDISTLHGGYGAVLDEGEVIRAPTELPNPFGGPPIPARAEVEHAGEDEQGCARLNLTVRPRPGAMKELVEQGFGTVVPDGTKFPDKLGMRHTAQYSYDEGSGWIVRVESVKDIRSGASRRTDRTVMTLDAPGEG